MAFVLAKTYRIEITLPDGGDSSPLLFALPFDAKDISKLPKALLLEWHPLDCPESNLWPDHADYRQGACLSARLGRILADFNFLGDTASLHPIEFRHAKTQKVEAGFLFHVHKSIDALVPEESPDARLYTNCAIPFWSITGPRFALSSSKISGCHIWRGYGEGGGCIFLSDSLGEILLRLPNLVNVELKAVREVP